MRIMRAFFFANFAMKDFRMFFAGKAKRNQRISTMMRTRLIP
jgi:hypothetical protein